MTTTALVNQFVAIQVALDRFAQIARRPDDLRLADEAQAAMRILKPRGRGRPRVHEGVGYWRYSKLLQKRVASIVSRRDINDPESITDVDGRLSALARKWVGSLTGAQAKQLRKLARTHKPSEIALAMHAFRYKLPIKTAKRLKRDVQEAVWE